MLNELLDILKNKSVDGYKIVQIDTMSHEFFFIRHQLEMNRAKDVSHTYLTVYKSFDDKSYLGSASQEIHPNSSREEMQKVVEALNYSAGFVKNPYYELAKPKEEIHPKTQKIDALQIAKDFMDAVSSVKESRDQTINSYEIFVNRKKTRIINSQGIDVSYESVDSQIEIVINSRKDDKEIELYRNYHAGTCDVDDLVSELNNVMRIGKDRSKAQPTPNLGKSTVLISGEAVAELFRYYISLCNVGGIYTQISTYEIDRSITAKVPTGDKITLWGVVDLPNSSRNAPYDEEGHPLNDRLLIEEGVCRNFWGNEQYSQYVKKSESAILRNFRFSPGNHLKEDFKRASYLEAIEFSDFQCDAATGNFAGEIRLGYFFDGRKTVPVTGGSISGNMKEVETGMLYSLEMKQHNNIVVPEVVCLFNVTVSGIDA